MRGSLGAHAVRAQARRVTAGDCTVGSHARFSQVDTLRTFWRDPRFRPPMITIWYAWAPVLARARVRASRCHGRLQDSDVRCADCFDATRASLLQTAADSDDSGGALHAPVTTYFYLELGASATDIGLIGSALTAASLVLSPFYGYLLDRFGAYPAMMVRPLRTCDVCRNVGQTIR